MSLFTLLVELALALVKALGLARAGAQSAGERATGAALQREEDRAHEEARIAAAARAGLGRLPDGPDPLDRDRAP